MTSEKAETEYLEFKGGRIQDDPSAVKRFWSQAISGFANTEGGVLIWGIRATRIEHPDDRSRKIDAASELDLVPQPATFVQLLKDVLLEACVEPVQGIELAGVDAGNGDGKGFVVCLIPEGKHKPYRAELDPKRQYYAPSEGPARHYAFVLPLKAARFRMRVFCLDQEEQRMEITFNTDDMNGGVTKQARYIE